MDKWLQKLQSKLPTLIVSILFAPTRLSKSNIMRAALGIGFLLLCIIFWPNSSSEVAQKASDSETSNAPRIVSKDCPLRVENYYDYEFKFFEIKIASLVDSITIRDIKLNRGNCSLSSGYSDFPHKLKFGGTRYYPHYCKSLLEAEIKTDKGICNLRF